MFDKDNKFGFIINNNESNNNNIEGLDKVKTDLNNIKSEVNELNTQYKDIATNKADKNTTDDIQQQVNNLVLGAVGDGNNAEVVQARGDKTTLNDRMDYFDNNIFDKQPTINTVEPTDTMTGKKNSSKHNL